MERSAIRFNIDCIEKADVVRDKLFKGFLGHGCYERFSLKF